MKISLVAGFGPIVREMEASLAFYRDALGIGFEGDEGYPHTDNLDGVRAFALWRLTDAARSTFGVDEWPSDIATPQAWLEFDVESHDAVGVAAGELEVAGYRMLRAAEMEEWGQTVARLLSPEGILVGIAHTPWMHQPADAAQDAEPEPITES
jgi:catechol 2,3-dioxygenase-like lactoylglutathione lyase family enzyme